MTERTLNLVDKATWPDGPWKSEPDKVQWVDGATGLDCLAVRNIRSGHWYGYVGVANGHPAFEKGYDDVDSIDVHGGLTFADKCQEQADGGGICHVPEPGRPDHVWWLGFDCAHAGDATSFARPLPGYPVISSYDTYRDLAYVKAQCGSLAGQLAAMAPPPADRLAALHAAGLSVADDDGMAEHSGRVQEELQR